MRRVAIVIAGLTGGGSERVATTLAGALARHAWNVSLLTLGGDETDFYSIPPAVCRVRLGVAPGSGGPWTRLLSELRLLRVLRRALMASGADVVVAFATETSVRTILACIGTGLPVVATERADPSRHDPGAAWTLLRRTVYGFAAAVVAQTVEAREWLVAHTAARYVEVIPNSVTVSEAAHREAVLPVPAVVGLGHFRPEKGFDQLVEAFALTREAHPEWHLVLVGDGPEDARLRALVTSRGLDGAVTFTGRTADPVQLLRQGDIFALPSHHEGFPNALLEAMACGLPAVCFDCSGGPRAIVRHGIDGLLVPPYAVPAFADALAMLMGDAGRRARYGAAARSVRERFSPGRITGQWLTLLDR